MEREALALLVAEEFAWGDGDLAIAPHERLDGLVALAGINMQQYREVSGSKKQKLRAAILLADEHAVAKLVERVLEELPSANGEPMARTRARSQLERWLDNSRGVGSSMTVAEQVAQSLAEFDSLLRDHGPGRAFDRLHSAFSAHLRIVHESLVGPAGRKPLYKLLEAVAGALEPQADPTGMARKMLIAIKSVISELDQLRNGPAHGEFREGEARLAKDLLMSAFHYLVALETEECA